MILIGTALMLVVGIVALLVAILAKRHSGDQLGSVSEQWIAQHRVNPP